MLRLLLFHFPPTFLGRWGSRMTVGRTITKLHVGVDQSLSCRLFATPWTAAGQASLSFTIRVCSNSCPLNQWYHPIISSSVIPFSCLQSFPASGSFSRWVSQLLASGVQSVGASASVLPVNFQGWFPLGLTSLSSLLSKGLSRVFSSSIVWKHQFFGSQHSLWSNSHIHTWPLEKPSLWLYRPFVGKVMSLLFNMLSRLFIAFLPRSKHLLISWLLSPSSVIWELRKIVSVAIPTFFPFYLPWSDGTRFHDLCFFNVF